MSHELSSDARRPFLAAPNPKRYFAGGSIEEARTRIVRCVARNEGPAVVVGGTGTGKSLLLAVLAEQFARHRSVASVMGSQICTRRGMLTSIAAELGLAYRGLDESELRLALLRHVRGEGSRARRLLVLVDEADALPVRLLEELRVLTNAATDGLPLVNVVLAGGAALEERFADPALESFSQRIAARCYLSPFGREETFQYVQAQVSAAGMAADELFEPAALEAMFAATGGVPRLVNQLGDQLTWMAEETGCRPLDATLVQQAWSDLQQLPAPWNADAHSSENTASVGVVEFGEWEQGLETLNELEPVTTFEIGGAFAVEEPPASIPISAGRGRRETDPMGLAAKFEAAEELVDELERFEAGERMISGGLPALYRESVEPGSSGTTNTDLPAAASVPAGVKNLAPSAANPFGEEFDDEEVVLDRYAAFEKLLVGATPRGNQYEVSVSRGASSAEKADVKPAAKQASLNGVKSELGDGGGRRSEYAESSREPSVAANKSVTEQSMAEVLPSKRETAGSVLLVEDEEQVAPAVIPGRQFRRLFSMLEANGTRSLSG